MCNTKRRGINQTPSKNGARGQSAAETGPSITKHRAHMFGNNFGRKKLEVPPTLTRDREVLLSRKAGLSAGVEEALLWEGANNEADKDSGQMRAVD